LVIEPFAGGMGYSLQRQPPSAIGIERDERLVTLWHRLCGMTEAEIRDFPTPVEGERSTDRWVISAAASNTNNVSESRRVNRFLIERFEAQRQMAIKVHAYARTHVLYSLGDYRQAPDIEATWFIDPPYQHGSGYRHGSADIDYDELAEWCMTRQGQRIICEGPFADWLPFKHHAAYNGPANYGAAKRTVKEYVLTRRTHARCALPDCGRTFPASRSDAKYCSPAHRKRASRAASAARLALRPIGPPAASGRVMCDDPLDVECLACGAGPGRPCWTRHHGRLWFTHRERAALARVVQELTDHRTEVPGLYVIPEACVAWAQLNEDVLQLRPWGEMWTD
jgi:hypothetical protein